MLDDDCSFAGEISHDQANKIESQVFSVKDDDDNDIIVAKTPEGQIYQVVDDPEQTADQKSEIQRRMTEYHDVDDGTVENSAPWSETVQSSIQTLPEQQKSEI
ncbi:MAG: hypothetical protein GY786_17700, partial [Proteobacteria bacterium]|nr:hypothetical protein [Pseudomonadota bacterium]